MPEELVTHSWAFLYNADGLSKKSNAKYRKREIPVLLKTVNCFTPCDEALKVMKWSDWFDKSWDWFVRSSNGFHYDRELIGGGTGNVREAESLALDLPALLKKDRRYPARRVRLRMNRRVMERKIRGYGWEDLEDPVGMCECDFYDENINGRLFGWAEVNCDDCHSDFLTRELSVMHPWYNKLTKYYKE